MSLLNFYPEVTLMFIRKINISDRINLSRTHSRLVPLCFDRTLNKISAAGTITLDELRNFYGESKNQNERDQCFHKQILETVQIKNFNEIVRFYMDRKNEEFVANDKVLEVLNGKIIVLVNGEGKYTDSFLKKFFYILKKIEGDLFLVIIDGLLLERKNQEFFEELMHEKLERGDKIHLIYYDTSRIHKFWLDSEMINFMMLPVPLTFFYWYHLGHDGLNCRVCVNKKNDVIIIKTVLDKIDNNCRLQEVKKYLMKFLLMLEKQTGNGKETSNCGTCRTRKMSTMHRTGLAMAGPLWLNCADC